MYDAKKAAVNLARKGRYGDTEIAHVERGERVVPMDFQEKMPKTMNALDMAMRAAGIDPARYTVAGTSGETNPASGVQEFHSKKKPVKKGPKIDSVPRWFSSAPGKRADLTYTTAEERALLRALGLGHSEAGSGEQVAPGKRQHMGPKNIPSYNGEGGYGGPGDGDTTDSDNDGISDATEGVTSGSDDYGGHDPSPPGYGGPGPAGTANGTNERTGFVEEAVKAFTRVTQLEKMEELGQLVEQGLEEHGINVDTGRPDEHGAMTGTGTGDYPGDSAGGSSDLTDEDRETPETPADQDPSLPEDPGQDDQQPADPDYSLTVSRAAVTMPNIGELIAAYSRRSPGAALLTNIAAPVANPRVNPDTGVQMFAREDHFDRDWYLEQNPDVAAAGADPWEHYQAHGRNEGRLGNQAEQAARDEGFTGEFGEGRYAAWKDQQMEPYKDGDSFGDDLFGGEFNNEIDYSTPGGLGVLADRSQARDRGYMGSWGGDGYNRFLDNYYDHDGDPSTHWVARNSSNVNRSGEDVGYTRELLRRAGYTGLWGDGGGGDWSRDALGRYGLDSSGTIEGDARAIYTASRRPPRPTGDLPWWMRGAFADIGRNPAGAYAPIDRNPAGFAGNATPNGSMNAIELLSGLTPDRRRRYVNTTNRRYAPGFVV